MNLFVLILIALPLALYLMVLAFSSRDFDPGVTSVPHTDDASHESSDVTAHVSEHRPAEEPSDAAVLETVARTDESAFATLEPKSETPAPTVVAAEADEPVVAVVEPGETETAAPVALAQADEPAPNAADEPAVESVPAELAADAKVVSAAGEKPAEAENTNAVAAAETIAEPTASTEPPPKHQDESPQPILSGQPLILPGDTPKYAFDYRGRLWVEKKRRGFFRQLRRPQLPPEDPTDKSNL